MTIIGAGIALFTIYGIMKAKVSGRNFGIEAATPSVAAGI